MLFCIYQSINLINSKSYIGYTKNFRVRKNEHTKARRNCPFHHALKKYGNKNFEWKILYTSNDKDFTQNIMEGYFIRLFDTVNNGYNLSYGGEGGKGNIQSIETRKKRSESHKGKIFSAERKYHISESLKGRPVSIETRQKIRDKLKGKPKPPRSNEHRINISKSQKGKYVSLETRDKISKTLKERNKK